MIIVYWERCLFWIFWYYNGFLQLLIVILHQVFLLLLLSILLLSFPTRSADHQWFLVALRGKKVLQQDRMLNVLIAVGDHGSRRLHNSYSWDLKKTKTTICNKFWYWKEKIHISLTLIVSSSLLYHYTLKEFVGGRETRRRSSLPPT